MFRAAQSNPFDEPVVRATDENLTQEDWGLIFTVVDKVEGEENGGKDAVAALIKRLAHRNANVQLYTLELANALSQNCKPKIAKELASRSFTDALLRLANDRNTHQAVKTRILERMTEWTEMFSNSPELGIMEQAYERLRSQNPSLQPPTKPFKQQITSDDRQKEEDELQMALALSVKEKPTDPRSKKRQQEDTAPVPASSTATFNSQATPIPPAAQGTTAATVSRVRALFDFQPSEPGELQFRKGDVIAVLESVYKDWWRGSLRGQTGIFPLNYVDKIQDPTQDEIEREAQMEAEVFSEIKNVEKLLTLLSTSGGDPNSRDNEEITSLYQQTIAIRPKLIELIGKYSQKKDDMDQLNQKFVKAQRDYDALLDQSMSHQSQGMYGRPPPSQSYGYGAPPPQQDQRYYTQPPQSQQPDNYGPPPREGPAPFHMIPPGQQHPSQQQPHSQAHYPPQPDYAKPHSPAQFHQQQLPSQTYQQPPLAELGRSSIYSQNPQELPTQPAPSGHPQQYQPSSQQSYSSQYSQQPPNRSSSLYSDADDLYAHPGQQQQPQPYQMQAPSQPPPGPPSSSGMTASPPPLQGQPYGAPPHGQNQGYPPHANSDIPAPLQPSHPGNAAAYQNQYRAYTPASLQVGAGGGGGSGDSADVSDYYR